MLIWPGQGEQSGSEDLSKPRPGLLPYPSVGASNEKERGELEGIIKRRFITGEGNVSVPN
jgi:hypothetical protein